MRDKEWAEKALRGFQQEETYAVERVKNAESNLANAKTELSEAKESLNGVRGCISEMTWQLEYLKEHGKLP
jgi:phage shock protein A